MNQEPTVLTAGLRRLQACMVPIIAILLLVLFGSRFVQTSGCDGATEAMTQAQCEQADAAWSSMGVLPAVVLILAVLIACLQVWRRMRARAAGKGA